MAARQKSNPYRGVVAAGLALALGAAPLCAATAGASTLDDLQAQIDSSTEAYNSAVEQALELQDKISENEQLIAQIEEELPEKKSAATTSIRTLYKIQQSASGLIDLLLSANDFNEVLTMVQYLDHVVERNSEAVSDLATASDELEQARSALASEKTQVDEQVSQAMSSLEQANSAREQYETELAAQQAAAEAAAKAEAEAKAKEEAAKSESTDAASGSEPSQTSDSSSASQQDSAQDSAADASSDSSTGADSGSGSTSGSGSASSSSSGSGSSSSGTSKSDTSTKTDDVKTDGEWMSGLASAYDLEDNTGWDATASGIPLTHDSMTVAVPVSQYYLLGRTVEIRYGGKTVTATVTDTGGFASYGRVLDLAGGVWQAFGYSSANDWGVRAISYRFL